jgi:hypothetical protein
MTKTPKQIDADISPALEGIFLQAFDQVMAACHSNSVNHGFWDDNPTDADRIGLCHTELSEALEGIRHGNPPDDKIPEFSCGEAELADAMIRIMDLAKKRGYRLGLAIIAKHRFNVTRPYKHGKAF